MELAIRTGSAADIDDVVRIFRECWQQAYVGVLSKEVRSAMTVEKAYELWRPSFSSHLDRETLVALIDDKAVGMARIGSDPDLPLRGHLFSLYIEPGSASKGFGRALLKAALAKLSERNFKEISLWVFKANPGAMELYRKMGFTPTGRERTDPRWRSVEVEMLHQLTTSQI
ncbi:MAG: GNAT family N-acetyltransferase [Actinobacteria bacterium]|nr:GNAT family N-acetyltransferase [Actinomycetota bacterium]